MERGILLLNDYRAELTSRTAAVRPEELQKVVSRIRDRSELETEFKGLINAERATYNTQERHENELLKRYERGFFKLRRYANWEYPFVVGLRKGYNGGKRGRRFFLDVDAAVAFIMEQSEVVRGATRKTLIIPEDDRVMLVRATERLAPFGKTLDHAVDFYISHLKQLETSILLKALSHEWRVENQIDGVPRARLNEVRARVRAFREDVGNIKARQVTAPMVDDHLRGIKQRPSRESAREALREVFAFAVARGYMAVNPALETVTEKLIRKDPGILHVPDLRIALQVVDADFEAVLWNGAWAGLRDVELEGLMWEHFLWGRKLIRIEGTGRAGPRFVQILPPLLTRLQKYHGLEGRVCRGDFASMVEKLRGAVGLKTWPPDTLRRSFACHHLAHFGHPKELLLTLGDADVRTVYRNFRHIVTAQEGQAWFDL